MRKKELAIRRFRLRKLARLHFVLMLLVVGTYLLIAFFDPGFLSYDLRQKFEALADTIVVTATVLPPPTKPVVTATAHCDTNLGELSVALDWADDSGATSFRIDRDGLPLTVGLTASTYTDKNVSVGTAYGYTVTAVGPMGPGEETSDPVSVTTDSECEVSIIPAVAITALNNKAPAAYVGTPPRITDTTPLFAGTTSIPNATIAIHVYGERELFAGTAANPNGFWSWPVPVRLADGKYTIMITATDPLNANRTASDTLQFRIVRDASGNEQDQRKGSPTAVEEPVARPPVGVSPLDFVVSVMNEKGEVSQGSDLGISVSIKQMDTAMQGKRVPLRFTMLDAGGRAIFSLTKQELLTTGRVLLESIPIPLYWTPGPYTLRTEILWENVSVSRDVSIRIIELPFIKVGEGHSISFATVAKNIGWLSFFLLMLLLFWLFLFLREYALMLKKLGDVSERDLRRAGFFS